MPTINFPIIRLTDDKLVRTFQQVWRESGASPDTTYSVSIGFGAVTGKMSDLDSDEQVKAIRQLRTSAITSLAMRTPRPVDRRLTFGKTDQGVLVTVQVADTAPPDAQTDYLFAVRKAFAQDDPVVSLERALGKEAAEYYRRREEMLTRLESLNEQLVDDAVAARRRIEEENAAYRVRLDSELDARKADLESEFQAKSKALGEREAGLEERLKQLDDRAPMHARRQLRADLKTILQQRNQTFALTRSTARKRYPIHALFVVLTVSTGVLAGLAFASIIDPAGGIASWVLLLRFSVAATAFLAAVAFYIRWNDSWAKAHADEEFKLKRLELDIDRASWVVEMVLEWRAAKGTQIPSELLDRLTNNLFAEHGGQRKARHPSEDLASALLRASASLRIPIPGVGELRLDRKSLERFERAADPDDGLTSFGPSMQ